MSVRQTVCSAKCPFGKTSVRQNIRRQNVFRQSVFRENVRPPAFSTVLSRKLTPSNVNKVVCLPWDRKHQAYSGDVVARRETFYYKQIILDNVAIYGHPPLRPSFHLVFMLILYIYISHDAMKGRE